MSGAIYIYWVALTLSAVKTAAFFALHHFDRANRPALIFGLAFATAGLSFAGEIALASGLWSGPTRMVIALAMVGMFVLIAHALALRYRVEISRGSGIAITAASALLYLLILDLPRDDFTRQMLYQLPYALLSAMALSIIWRARTRVWVEWLFMALFTVLAVYFLSKPFVAGWTGGVGIQPRDFSTTSYAALSVASGAILLVILAMAALGVTISDSAARIILRSERDPDTGLLTRTGFAEHAARRLSDTGRLDRTTDRDIALALFAIDAPRQQSSTQQPVKAIADLLIAKCPREAIIGRMSEVDFAVLLPAANLFAARGLAEQVRKAAAGMDNAAATVSIGITERESNDVYAEMLARALWALAEAQRGGGNAVRLAARSGFGLTRFGQV